MAGSHARWYRSRAMWTAGVVAIEEPSASGGQCRHLRRCPLEDRLAMPDEQRFERQLAELPDRGERLVHVVSELRVGVAHLAALGRQRIARDEDAADLIEHRHVADGVAWRRH